MLTIKDDSGRVIITLCDDGKTIIEDKDLEREMILTAKGLEIKEAKQPENPEE